jgi:subtilase family serine protease
MKQVCRVVRPLLGVILCFCSLPVFAQRPEPRLGKAITDGDRAVLSESRTPRVGGAQDLGPVSPAMTVPGITLVFRRSPTQEAALQDLLAAQQNLASPQYHQWLTPETFAARFGVADQDIATAESWLISQGFHIEEVARSRDRISFSGSAAQVQTAFGAELHRYRTKGELHFGPVSDLTLPTGLASVTAAVLHLSDFRPKPSSKVMTGAQPDFTSSATQAHYLTPKDISTMYDLNPFYTRYGYGGGQALAVVGQSFVNTSSSSSVETFQSNLTQADPASAVLVPGSGVQAISPGDEGESEIDLEYSSGIAQNANIFLVYVGANQNYSVFDALAFAITERIAPVVSISYSICEPLLSQSELDQYSALFEEASAQGQTLVAASGDSGSTACAPDVSASGVTLAEPQELSVSFPASSPNVTAVGGTQMAAGTFAAGNSPYWASAGSTDNVSSLLSYVPEVVWNEDSATNGIAGGGGGSSIYFPRPTWQSTYPGMPTGSYRLLPDIALQASMASPGFLVCSSDPALLGPQGQTSSCVSGILGNNDKYTLAGGTSFAAPIFAGFIALLNAAENSTGQGNINPVLYSLAASPSSYAAAFHDITSGTNACAAGDGSCAAAGESAYAATVGYDEATGLGSVDFNVLASAWPLSNTASLQPTMILITSSETTALPGQTVPIQIYVNSLYTPTGSSVPTGSISVSVDGTVMDSSLAFSATNTSDAQASVTYSFVAPTSSGSHLIAVTYPGDATHSPSMATYSVLVGNVVASGGMSLTAGNLTVANGSTASTEVTVTPDDGYSGRVVWSVTAASASDATLTACYAIASLPVSNTSTTNLTIGIGTACNSPLPADGGDFRSLNNRTLANAKAQGRTRTTPATVAYASLLLCGLLAGWRRKWRPALWLMVLFLPVAAANLIGCGGGGGNTSSASTTTPTSTSSSSTSYSITLTGTDSVNSSIASSTTFTLTVN